MAGSPRVLQVVLSLNPGGTERLVVELVRRLNPDIPMAVCCLDEEGAWGATLRDEAVDVTALRRPAGFRPSLGRAVADAARRHAADVIHCHHYSPFVYACTARLWRPTSRVIFTEHGRLSDAPPSRKRRVANALLARVPRRVFAVSEDLKRHLVWEGFASDRVQVIYNGIEVGPMPPDGDRLRVRQQLRAPERALVLGTIARLDTVKDLATLLRSVAVLQRRREVMLVIIGDGPERQSLMQLAEGLELGDRVTFLGHRDDARCWLAGFDVYVNSSISEGVSLTILEAMAAGLPIVATAVGGTPEVVNASVGRLVPSRDPDAIATAVAQIADDPEWRRQMGRAARGRVEHVFTIDRMVADYRDVYRSAA